MKKIYILLSLTYLFISKTIMASPTGTGGMPVGTTITVAPPLYYNRCVDEIHATRFGSAALDGGTYGLKAEQRQFLAYEKTLLQVVQKTNADKVNNIESIFSELTSFMVKSKNNDYNTNYEITRKEKELRTEYKNQLKADVDKSKRSGFNDKDKNESAAQGTFTYEHMKNLCQRTKMYEKTQGSTARIVAANTLHKRAGRNMQKRQSVVNTIAEGRKAQEKHYQLFCSPEDFKNKLCDVVSALPNGDLDADVFLKPTGFNKSSGVSADYQTQYTYNELEALAADSFSMNVIGLMPVEPPTPAEIKEEKTVKFASLYNSMASALNIAGMIFDNAYQNRLPKNKEGLRLSAYDTIAYLIYEMKKPQTETLEGMSKGNSFEMSYQSVLALKTKIDLEILMQKERLKLLEATNLALEENKVIKIRNLERKK